MTAVAGAEARHAGARQQHIEAQVRTRLDGSKGQYIEKDQLNGPIYGACTCLKGSDAMRGLYPYYM